MKRLSVTGDTILQGGELGAAGRCPGGLVFERTTAALVHQRSLGQRVGQIPMGARLGADGVHLEQEPAELATLADLGALRAAGLSWQAIADEFNRRGIATKKGRAWTWQTARRAGLGR